MNRPGRPKGEYRRVQPEGAAARRAPRPDAPRARDEVLPTSAATGTTAGELYAQLGLITRRLQDALSRLDAMPRLQASAHRLPDARSRLGDIAERTFAAADKVLTSVELAKRERERIDAAAQRLQQEPAAAVRCAAEVQAAASRIDAHLTDIMVAQDFHDLSGQMLAQVAAVAVELEDGLLQLLADGASAPSTAPPELARSQREVDELLASHGI